MVSATIISGVLVFCVGIYLLFSLSSWLKNDIGLSSELTSNFIPVAFVGLFVLTIASMIGIPIVLMNNYNKEVEKKYRGIQIANIDSMTGIEFEQYLEKVLTNQGYKVSMTDVSGDLGVDLVASGNGSKIAIQAKRHSNKVSRRAISDAVAGMYHYDCDRAMVITNNYFSPGAVTLAESTSCTLIDRDTLAKWVIEFQNSEPRSKNI
jgi:HJR/Mrr/RecB family endonuclease